MGLRCLLLEACGGGHWVRAPMAATIPCAQLRLLCAGDSLPLGNTSPLGRRSGTTHSQSVIEAPGLAMQRSQVPWVHAQDLPFQGSDRCNQFRRREAHALVNHLTLGLGREGHGGAWSDDSEDLSEEDEGEDQHARPGAPDCAVDEERHMLIATSRKLQTLAKAGAGAVSKVREVAEEIAALEEQGVLVDARLVTDLINAYRRCGKMELALQTFDKYFQPGKLQADEVVMGVLVRGLGSATPPAWATISSLLGKMKKEHGIDPPLAVYNELLLICAKTNAVDNGKQVVQEMVRKGLEPDLHTLNVVKQRKILRSHIKKVFQL